MTATSVPADMKAWVGGAGAKQPSWTTVPLPELEGDDILVKVTASGVCHSDCLILALPQNIPGWKEQFVMGHEGAGIIAKIGTKIENASLKEGQNVAVLCTPGCGQSACGECSRGYTYLCQKGRNPGLGSHGVFGEYVAVKPWGIVPVPDGIPPEIAAISCDAVLTAYHAVKIRANVQAGQTIIIFGLGGVGFNGLQIAMHLGASRIIVVDQRQEVLDEAIKLGVAKEDAIVAGPGATVKVEEKVAVEGIVVDTTIDFVSVEETFISAQLSVRPAGTVVLVGLFKPQLPLMTLPALLKAIDIRCCYNGTRDEMIECLNLIAKGVIKPRVETGSLSNLVQVLEDLDAGKIKSRMVLLPA